MRYDNKRSALLYFKNHYKKTNKVTFPNVEDSRFTNGSLEKRMFLMKIKLILSRIFIIIRPADKKCELKIMYF